MSTPLARRIFAAALAATLTARLLAADPPASPAKSFTSPDEIPVEHFFRGPALRDPKLNVAGTHVGMVIHEPAKDAHGLMIYALADGKTSGTRGGSDYDVAWFSWAGDDRVVFSVARENLYAWGLYAMKASDSRSIVTLNQYDVVRVLGTPHARPDSLLVWIEKSARNRGHPDSLRELDLRRSVLSHFGEPSHNIRAEIPLPPARDGISSLLRDRTGDVRFAITHRNGARQLFRRDDGDKWHEIPLDYDRDTPLAVDADPGVLLIAHLADDGSRELRRYDTRTGSLGPVLHKDEKYDFSTGDVVFSADDRDVIGLTYPRQATEQVWFKRDDATLQASINAVLPANRLNRIVSRSRDGQRLLIASSSDRRPGPMIVVPHGGPWHRDTWGYDAWSQFLASRGYIVFRPNYRGSTGYNEEISLRPRMEFRRMHDDVTDGVRALVAAKIADPSRLAIFGGSFGGYLAMAGAAFEPGLYRCATSFAGVFDVEQMMKDGRSNENDFRLAWFRRELGNPTIDREKFNAMSPYQHVAEIKCPVFIAHGEEDRNADTGQSRRLVRALAKAGVPHEAMFVSEEGHGLAALKHRVEFFTRLEAFLKKHL